MKRRNVSCLAAAVGAAMLLALGGCSAKQGTGQNADLKEAGTVADTRQETAGTQNAAARTAQAVQAAEEAAKEADTALTAAGAQAVTEWPQKAVSLIVPAGAGGGTDTNARLLAKYLTAELGQPVNVVNITGSSGAMGLKEAKNSENDGYTFVYFNEDTVTNQKLGVMDFGYEDLDMIANLYHVDMYLVGNGSIPDVETLKKKAAEKPGELVFGGESSAFISLLPYIINEKLGIELKIVDGGQMSERLPLMVGKQIDLTFAPMSQIRDYLDTGDLNAVALLADERSENAPDIATGVDQGLDIVYNRFQCVMGPKGIDDAVKEKLAAAIKTVSENPEFMKESANNGVDIQYTDAGGLTGLMEEYSMALEEYMKYIPQQ